MNALAAWGRQLHAPKRAAENLDSIHRTLGWYYRMGGIARDHAQSVIDDAEQRGVADARDSLACLGMWGRWHHNARAWELAARKVLDLELLAREREADTYRSLYDGAVTGLRELESEES